MPTRLDRYLTLALLVLLPVLCMLTSNNFYKSLLIFGIISSISATGLCLMLGLGGQISLGQAAFFGLGAYVTANLGGKLGVEPLLAIVAGALLSMVIGWAISRPLSRLHDHYLATIALFGPDLCMFTSNFPRDRLSISYGVLWNEHKILAKLYTAYERAALFHGTAARVYRLKNPAKKT